MAACSDSTADIVVKAKDAGTTAQLTEAIGKPDSIEKIGPLARWIYQASDGEVTFIILGNRVTTSTSSRN